jgi:hypothetical protein
MTRDLTITAALLALSLTALPAPAAATTRALVGQVKVPIRGSIKPLEGFFGSAFYQGVKQRRPTAMQLKKAFFGHLMKQGHEVPRSLGHPSWRDLGLRSWRNIQITASPTCDISTLGVDGYAGPAWAVESPLAFSFKGQHLGHGWLRIGPQADKVKLESILLPGAEKTGSITVTRKDPNSRRMLLVTD